MLEPSTSVQYVKGIGPRLAEVLAAKGLRTVDDLLHYLPFRYEDRLNPRSVAELRAGEMATVIAEVRNSGLFRTRRMPIFQLTVGQGRSRLKCIWFHAAYLQDRFQAGQMVALYGKVEEDRDGGLQIVQPQFEILGDINEAGGADEAEKKAAASLEIGRIVPIYESTGQGKLTPRWFRRIIRFALENLNPDLDFADPIPAAVRGHLSLASPREALWKVHWPDAGESFADLQASRTAAHIRLIFDELFFIELGLELKRREQKAQTGVAFQINDGVRAAIKKILPFHPTSAQKRVLKEIATDMQTPCPMRRLLQGDVGSGKTIVAFQAAIIAIENGYQVALMAPTEILAQQHYFSARQILERAGYRIVLLTGSLEEDRKRDVRRHIAQGNAQLIIGTHALIQDRVEFERLGLVVVDEQHRFGVMQRLKLMKKTDEARVDNARVETGFRPVRAGESPAPTQTPDQPVSTMLVQVDKSGKATPVRITSARLNYTDAERKIVLDGGVTAKGSDTTLTGRQMTVFLLPSSQTPQSPTAARLGTAGHVERIVAEGKVVITQPTRHATGDRLVYTAVEDKFVLTGGPSSGPPSIFDAERGKITGDSLTFFRHDDRVLVEGRETSPTITKTQVAR
jgi:RecG-like helicase/lipopolysaccharide export system protein LptA